MHFLYHRVPENMSGNRIFPLSELKEHLPDVYESARKKYVGREQLMKEVIIPLNCLWNEAVFLSPVHPAETTRAMEAAGHPTDMRDFFQIDASTLDPALTTVWLHKGNSRNPEDFVPFIPEELGRYSKLPMRTVVYYWRQKTCGQRPLVWLFVPHILFKGSIDVSRVERIRV